MYVRASFGRRKVTLADPRCAIDARIYFTTRMKNRTTSASAVGGNRSISMTFEYVVGAMIR